MICPELPPLLTLRFEDQENGTITTPRGSPWLTFELEDCNGDLHMRQRRNLDRILDTLNQAIAGRTLVLE